jgi:myxalamid-type nonribosomal peptide synthetase MxaA
VILADEAILGDDIVPCAQAEPISAVIKALLTGSTGFVGKYILHELMKAIAAKVHCLSREASCEKPFKKIRKGMLDYGLWDDEYKKRIVAVFGDLSKPRLGIDSEVYEYLCKELDVVYHSASYIEHLASFDHLIKANVEGLKNVLRFACSYKQKEIEYRSTIVVFDRFSKQ